MLTGAAFNQRVKQPSLVTL